MSENDGIPEHVQRFIGKQGPASTEEMNASLDQGVAAAKSADEIRRTRQFYEMTDGLMSETEQDAALSRWLCEGKPPLRWRDPFGTVRNSAGEEVIMQAHKEGVA